MSNKERQRPIDPTSEDKGNAWRRHKHNNNVAIGLEHKKNETTTGLRVVWSVLCKCGMPCYMLFCVIAACK